MLIVDVLRGKPVKSNRTSIKDESTGRPACAGRGEGGWAITSWCVRGGGDERGGGAGVFLLGL